MIIRWLRGAVPAGRAPKARRGRRGMTLLEVMVSVGIMMLFVAALVPSLDAVLLLEQRGAARKLALIYTQLHDEAVLRNKTFRIAYHLDANYYEIEVGDPGALIFTNPEAREEYEENVADRIEDLSPEDLREYKKREDFAKIQGEFEGKIELPENTRLYSVYTPQYEDPVRPREPGDRRATDADKPNVAYSYIFANGFAEYTVVQMVDREDEEDGFTITVDPLSGKVDLYTELIDQHDAFEFVPDDGPTLSL